MKNLRQYNNNSSFKQNTTGRRRLVIKRRVKVTLFKICLKVDL